MLAKIDGIDGQTECPFGAVFLEVYFIIKIHKSKEFEEILTISGMIKGLPESHGKTFCPPPLSVSVPLLFS